MIAAIAAVTFIWVLGVHIQHTNRMDPFVMDGDLVIAYKLDKSYREGDVVLYRNPETGEKALSRVAAVGSNEIVISETGELYKQSLYKQPNEKRGHEMTRGHHFDILRSRLRAEGATPPPPLP